MPPLIRRRPLLTRIKEYFNPLDFLLWASEELETSDWQQRSSYATSLGLSLNIVFLIARANSGLSGASESSDVFSDAPQSSLTSWFAAFIAHFLAVASILNAIFAFNRQRRYRLFEAPVDVVPSTPSAQRVRVDSSPASSSPLQLFSRVIASTTAEARSHPDPSRDVWELAIWDPTPVALRLFCLFSPGHVLIYSLFLPTSEYDPRPSTTVFKTLVLAGLLSAQMLWLQSSFDQQQKDTALIQKEVMHEYDVKYVTPRLNPSVREVGTQCYEPWNRHNAVTPYTPTTLLKKEFKINPNPNYAKHFDPDGGGYEKGSSRNTGESKEYANAWTTPQVVSKPSLTEETPIPLRTPLAQRDFSSPLRPQTAVRYSQYSKPTGDGGSLGVYTHANSPLKKSASVQGLGLDGRTKSRSPQKREGSPLKRTSMPGGGRHGALENPWMDHVNGFTRRESGRF